MAKSQGKWSNIMTLRIVGTLLVFGGVALAALTVWQSGDNTATKATKDTTSTTTPVSETNNQPAPQPTGDKVNDADKSYADDFIAFKYPASWKVSKQYTFTDFYGAHAIEVKAPIDASLAPADSSQKNLFLNTSITIFRDGRFNQGCAGCGKVFAVTPVSLVGGPRGSLVIAESGSPDQPAIVDLTREAVTVGAASYVPNGIRVGSEYNVRVLASYNSDQISLVGFKSVDYIKNSAQYQQLVKLISTIQVTSNNLPH